MTQAAATKSTRTRHPQARLDEAAELADQLSAPAPFLLPDLCISYLPIDSLRPYVNNARTHSKRQIKQIALSMEEFGFTNPVLISEDNQIIAGHGRVRAAEMLGMKDVPTVRLAHLSEAQRRAYTRPETGNCTSMKRKQTPFNGCLNAI